MADETRVLLIDRGKEQLRITIPANWKVTFGVTRSSREMYVAEKPGFGGAGRDLRLYEGGEHCRAVFTNVDSFRDLSIPVQRREVTRRGQESWHSDGKSKRSESSENLTTAWVEDGDDGS